MTISKRVEKLLDTSSLIRKISEEANILKKEKKTKVYDLSLGNPILDPPPSFYKSLKNIILNPKEGSHKYMSNSGFLLTRKAIASHLNNSLTMPIKICSSHIFTCVGAAGGVNVCLKTILDQDDEVILISPYFVEYPFYIDNYGAKPVIVQSDDKFQLDLSLIEKKLSNRTKLILINTPNNPTGVVYSKNKLKELSFLLENYCSKTGQVIYLLNDTPYRNLLFDSDICEPIEIYKNSIMVTSFSKDMAIPGERIGYIAVSPLCQFNDRLQQGFSFSSRALGFVNAPSLMQKIIPDLLKENVNIDWYRNRRNVLYEGLKKIGYELVKPEGAFYLFPKVPIHDEELFFNTLKKYYLLVVPGKAFGLPGYFRIAYCTCESTINESLKIFELVFNELLDL